MKLARTAKRLMEFQRDEVQEKLATTQRSLMLNQEQLTTQKDQLDTQAKTYLSQLSTGMIDTAMATLYRHQLAVSMQKYNETQQQATQLTHQLDEEKKLILEKNIQVKTLEKALERKEIRADQEQQKIQYRLDDDYHLSRTLRLNLTLDQ